MVYCDGHRFQDIDRAVDYALSLACRCKWDIKVPLYRAGPSGRLRSIGVVRASHYGRRLEVAGRELDGALSARLLLARGGDA